MMTVTYQIKSGLFQATWPIKTSRETVNIKRRQADRHKNIKHITHEKEKKTYNKEMIKMQRILTEMQPQQTSVWTISCG